MAHATVGVAGIEYIQGAMKKPVKKDGHKHGSYLIMTHRTAPTTNPNCQRVYAKNADAYTRSTEPSARELESRARLAAAARATHTRIANLSTIEADEAAWRAQKDQPGGKKTFFQYIFNLGYDKLRS